MILFIWDYFPSLMSGWLSGEANVPELGHVVLIIVQWNRFLSVRCFESSHQLAVVSLIYAFDRDFWTTKASHTVRTFALFRTYAWKTGHKVSNLLTYNFYQNHSTNTTQPICTERWMKWLAATLHGSTIQLQNNLLTASELVLFAGVRCQKTLQYFPRYLAACLMFLKDFKIYYSHSLWSYMDVGKSQFCEPTDNQILLTVIYCYGNSCRPTIQYWRIIIF